MNKAVEAGQVSRLGDLVEYEQGKVTNVLIAKNDGVRFVVMAFDEGTALSTHRAPTNALVTVLEGMGVITYAGVDYLVKEGENFLFAKDVDHSVSAPHGRFKMSLMLVF